MSGKQLLIVSDELKCAVMPVLNEGFPEMPPGVAKQAVRLMADDGWSVDKAVAAVNRALRDFVPEYGVTYPSVAYILGKRSGDAPEEHGNYLIDGKPFEQVYTIC